MTRRGFVLAAALLPIAGPNALAQSTSGESVVTTLTVFAGTAEGLWRSKDWGATWQRAESKPGGVKIEELRDVRALLASSPRVYAGGANGLFLSDDFGVTWTRVAEEQSILAVLPGRYPQADPTLFLGTASGLLRSEDAGRTFKPTALSGTAVRRIEWPGPALVVCGEGGVRISKDAGAGFDDAGSGLPSGDAQALALSSFFAVDPVLFVGLRGRGVYRSSDGGRSWSPAGLQDKDVRDLYWLGPFLYAATDGGVFRTEDLGRNWVALNDGLKASPSRLLFPLAPDSGAVIFAATDGGVYRSADGGLHWSASGMSGQAVLSIATFPTPDRVPGKKKK